MMSLGNQRGANFIGGFTALLTLLVTSCPLSAQDQTTTTGMVVLTSPSSVTVRTSSGQFQLFIFERFTKKPPKIPLGAQVRVLSSPAEAPGRRVANQITVTEEPSPASSKEAEETVVPGEVRDIERSIQKEVQAFQIGLRAGFALDPELAMVGAQAQIGPFFHSGVYFRPNFEFLWGQITDVYSINPEFIYRLPITTREGRWSTYFGAGPGFNLTQRSVTAGTVNVSNFTTDVSLNILGGVRDRSGLFLEMRTSIYASPSPVFRLIIGYDFYGK